MALPRLRTGRREPLSNQEKKHRRYDEKDEGISREAIGEPPPPRGLQIFLHRHGPNVTHSAPVKIAGRAVVLNRGAKIYDGDPAALTDERILLTMF
jgi:hypothetical protein